MSATRISTPSPLATGWRTLQALAQRHEFRIALDVGDEIEHLSAACGARGRLVRN